MNADSKTFAIDFHVHTNYSYDCPMPPRLVIEMARRRGLNGIAITDHDTVAGALATKEANRHSDFLVIPGIEVRSDLGDVIALYVDREIRSRRLDDVVREIHDCGGLVHLPHPVRTFGVEQTKEIHTAYPGIDLWEIYNGRYGADEMLQSRQLFKKLPKVHGLCGSDAHFPWEIGIFRTLLSGVPHNAQTLLDLSRGAELKCSTRSEISLSVGIAMGAMTKQFKRGEYCRLGKHLAVLPWKALKKSARAIFKGS